MLADHMTPDTMVDLARFILAVEIVLAALALLLAGVRAFGSETLKSYVNHWIVVMFRFMHVHHW